MRRSDACSLDSPLCESSALICLAGGERMCSLSGYRLFRELLESHHKAVSPEPHSCTSCTLEHVTSSQRKKLSLWDTLEYGGQEDVYLSISSRVDGGACRERERGGGRIKMSKVISCSSRTKTLLDISFPHPYSHKCECYHRHTYRQLHFP